MTFDEFMKKVLDAFPDAEVGEDIVGQIVIYTGLKQDAFGGVVAYDEKYGSRRRIDKESE